MDFLIDSHNCLRINIDDDFYFDVKEAINKVSSDTPMIPIDMHFNQNDNLIFEQLKIEHNMHFNSPFNGNVNSLNDSLKNFFNSLSHDNNHISGDAANLLSNKINSIFQANNYKNLWVYSAISKAGNKPYRWHTDVPFRYDAAPNLVEYNEAECSSNKEFFVLFTVKGPATVFYDLDDSLREQFAEFSQIKEKETKTAKINSLIDESKIIFGESGKAYVTLNGLWHGMVHSHPQYSNQDRVFVAVGEAEGEVLDYLNSKWGSK